MAELVHGNQIGKSLRGLSRSVRGVHVDQEVLPRFGRDHQFEPVVGGIGDPVWRRLGTTPFPVPAVGDDDQRHEVGA